MSYHEKKEVNHINKTIIHVAQVAKSKHQKDLIEAFIPLAKDFPEFKIAPRGISGDVTVGVYDRLDAITCGHPAKIFLMIG